MTIDRLRAGLAAAELAYAAFNAGRTAAAGAQPAQLGHGGPWRWVLDRSRPQSAYYNRAVLSAQRSVADLGDADWAALPDTVVCVELPADGGAPEAPAPGGGPARSGSDAWDARGFRLEGALAYLGWAPGFTDPSVDAHARSAVSVQRWGPERADAFLDLLSLEGVPMPPERRAQVQVHYGSDRFQTWVALTVTGQPAGWATMHVDEHRRAFLGNAYTLPEFRGRGAHAALLAARLQAAARQGLVAVYTDVEPGSDSERHVRRGGLQPLGRHQLWCRGQPR